MKRLLTAGIFGTILGIVSTGTANASIVSSGFLDEKLTEMTNATTLQLDTKANQSDLVNLSNIVGTPMELTYDDILRSSFIYDIMGINYYNAYADNTVPTNNISELIRLNYTDIDFPGLAGVVQSLFEQRKGDNEWPLRLVEVFNDYRYLYEEGHFSITDLIIDGGKLNGRGVTVYGLKDLTTKVDTNTAKIGTLPDGLTIQGMYDGWTSTDDDTFMGLKELNALFGYRADLKKYGFAIGSAGSRVSAFTSGVPSDYYEEMQELLDFNNMTINYPNTMTDFMKAFYGSGNDGIIFSTFVGWGESVDGKPKHKGLFGLNDAINGSTDSTGNVIEPGLRQITNGLNTKIGDLPTEIPNMDLTWEKYGFVESGTPIDLPDTIGGMFAMLFNEDASYNGLSLRNIMAKILMGFDVSGGRIKGLSPLSAAYDLMGDSPIVTAVKANTAKIGDLPTEYATVGAALTAIKGIAEDAKAAALAAIPDPKQEGSSGKFVLTVDIVGDNATYRWEKIDREGETTTTTE